MTDREAQLERRVKELESEVEAIWDILSDLQDALATEDLTMAADSLTRHVVDPAD